MANEQEVKIQEETLKSLERMQNFDVDTLPQDKRLGSGLNFTDAVEPALRIIGLYSQFSVTVLEDMPSQVLNIILSQANTDYSYLNEILEFSQEQASPGQARINLIAKIESAYVTTFTNLHQYISYSTSKSADFKRLENEARAMIQTVKDKGDELTQNLENNRQQAEDILKDVRKVAAEQGVSQQAVYFKDIAVEHEEEAEKWRKSITGLAVLLGIYAILSVFIHKIPFLTPEDVYQSVQLGVSKVLIFTVISYMLFLSVRNYLAHKHNAIVNTHRKNALLTYTALVDAAQDIQNKEVILTHASACIFESQTTGYSRDSGSKAPSAKSVVELLTKPLSSVGE